MTDEDVIVRACDLRAARLCLPGAQRWLEAAGYDWRGFLRNGLSARAIAAVGDARTNRLIEAARARVARENGAA